jgi:vacuolar-type H+-ATPase subunit I/STV1
MLGYTYLLYIGLSVVLTVWVGQTLFKNGRVFLLENYGDKPNLADAINHMLLVGFYLINIGFIAYTMKISGAGPSSWTEALEFLSVKIGFVAIILGVMHFCLMYALQKYSQLNLARPGLSKVTGSA